MFFRLRIHHIVQEDHASISHQQTTHEGVGPLKVMIALQLMVTFVGPCKLHCERGLNISKHDYALVVVVCVNAQKQ
jgi:hypothetical protein